MNRDTRAVLLAFGVGAVFGPAMVWGAAWVVAVWMALLGWL
jgi:hypothetical protein